MNQPSKLSQDSKQLQQQIVAQKQQLQGLQLATKTAQSDGSLILGLGLFKGFAVQLLANSLFDHLTGDGSEIGVFA